VASATANGTLSSAGERLREVGLAAARGAEQQDVALLQLDVVAAADAGVLLVLDAPVVVVDRDGEDLLRVVLPDDVVVEERADLARGGQLVEVQLTGVGELLLDDLVAEVDALVADVHAGPGDELLDLLLRLAAERALQQLTGVTELRHSSIPSPLFGVDECRRDAISGWDRCGPPHHAT
jgi:hypothetical protein